MLIVLLQNLLVDGSSQFSDLSDVLRKDTRCKDEKYPHCEYYPHRPHFVSGQQDPAGAATK